MSLNDQFFWTPDLEAAVERSPLIVTPQTSLQEALALMSQARGSSCLLASDTTSVELLPHHQARASCALIMEESKLLGILTERDLVKLTAAELKFDAVTVAEVMTHPVVTLSEANFQDVFAALFLFRRYRLRHLPLVDAHNHLVGVITPATIRQAMHPTNFLKLRRVAEVMRTNVVHAPLTTSVLELAQLMTTHRVSCVIITEVDEEEEILIPVGVVTEGDLMQFQSLQLKLNHLEAYQVMSTPLFLISPEDSLLTAHLEMQRRGVKRLVVSWNWGQGIGIITQTSLLRVFDPMEMYRVIETLQNRVQQLEKEKSQLFAQVQARSQFEEPRAPENSNQVDSWVR